jgi:hypothetical protein
VRIERSHRGLGASGLIGMVGGKAAIFGYACPASP